MANRIPKTQGNAHVSGSKKGKHKGKDPHASKQHHKFNKHHGMAHAMGDTEMGDADDGAGAGMGEHEGMYSCDANNE